jgi:hypothetical protein
VLDPCYITLQLGDMTKFVMQNGGYVSTLDGVDEGWSDEQEISRDNKKKIYWPLLNRVMTEIIAQMVNMNLTFEEFVALKAIVTFQMTIADTSEAGKSILKHQLNEMCRSLFDHYASHIPDEAQKAERFGSIILLLSPIFDTATNFVESHHQVHFFDLWLMDSLLLQFLKRQA